MRFKQKYTREPTAAWKQQEQLPGKFVRDVNGLTTAQGNTLARK